MAWDGGGGGGHDHIVGVAWDTGSWPHDYCHVGHDSVMLLSMSCVCPVVMFMCLSVVECCFVLMLLLLTR